ncbi:unnamed protein product [Phytomonas sp. EM1]|nr:unnamed protein product [Phytomonas sp. EM1]|eukprot:CCW61940.1 unnamed protein product [Phytomonas sp. isolate EM1]
MSYNIRIRNLPDKYDEDALLRLCASFGEVISYKQIGSGTLKKHNTYASETNKGVCTVEVTFEEEDDARVAAGNMEGMEFSGRYLRVFCLS